MHLPNFRMGGAMFRKSLAWVPPFDCQSQTRPNTEPQGVPEFLD